MLLKPTLATFWYGPLDKSSVALVSFWYRPTQTRTTANLPPPVPDPSHKGNPLTTHTTALPEFAAHNLIFAAQTVDDLEDLRIASANRFRMLTTDTPDSDGIVRGSGLPLSDPDVVAAQTVLLGILELEKMAIKELESQMRKHPLGDFISKIPGVGNKTGARLIASIGDPYWMSIESIDEAGTVTATERPRTVSELWAYCGYAPRDGQAVRRTKGVKSNWNAEAKKRVWVITSAAAKFIGSPLDVHQRAYKAAHQGVLHTHECVRCGPSGKPAQVGSPLSAGHLHARAIRSSSKELLRMLWAETKSFYDDPTRLEETRTRVAKVNKLKLAQQKRVLEGV